MQQLFSTDLTAKTRICQFISRANLGDLRPLPSGGRFPVRLSNGVFAARKELRSIGPRSGKSGRAGSNISYLSPKHRLTKINDLPPAA